MMKAIRTPVILVNLYQSTWHYNLEDSHLHPEACLLGSHFFMIWYILLNLMKTENVAQHSEFLWDFYCVFCFSSHRLPI
jgi:hypothetical protein